MQRWHFKIVLVMIMGVVFFSCINVEDIDPPVRFADSSRVKVLMRDAFSANIEFYLNPDEIPNNEQKLFIKRTNTNNSYSETHFLEIEQRNGNLWRAIDNKNLILDNIYDYQIQGYNTNGFTDTLTYKEYYHFFHNPIKKINQISIDSILLSLDIDTLSHGLKLFYNDDTINIQKELQNFTLSCNPLVEDSLSVFYTYLGKNQEILTTQRSFPYSFQTVFPKVSDILIIPINSEVFRVTWSFPGIDTINVSHFTINDTMVNLSQIQMINGKCYYCIYYHKNYISSNTFTIIPYNQNYTGVSDQIINNKSFEKEEFTYIDIDYGSGIYFCNNEMTNLEFYNLYYQNKYLVSDTSWLNSEDFNSDGTVKTGRENYPVRGVPFNVVTTRLQIPIPTEEQWEIAARGGSGDGRIYPWGYELPNKNFCNFASESPNTIKNLYGAVLINSNEQMYGPYNMSGNVAEWTQGMNGPVAKGGSYISQTADKLKISNKEGYADNVSYPHVGIRRVLK